ncbi:MAG: hypothetical protein BMS9Abin28_0937 [Anaerolineae bacterium]|nr:MAG: hypothetical protein BMS9Abin28_0937 [Anaerolineae bacterium]
MNINLGMVEWEEGRRSSPGRLGKKLAVALSVVLLAALALGNWLAAPDLSIGGQSSSAIAEDAFAADQEIAQDESFAPAGSQVFTR